MNENKPHQSMFAVVNSWKGHKKLTNFLLSWGKMWMSANTCCQRRLPPFVKRFICITTEYRRHHRHQSITFTFWSAILIQYCNTMLFLQFPNLSKIVMSTKFGQPIISYQYHWAMQDAWFWSNLNMKNKWQYSTIYDKVVNYNCTALIIFSHKLS